MIRFRPVRSPAAFFAFQFAHLLKHRHARVLSLSLSALLDAFEFLRNRRRAELSSGRVPATPPTRSPDFPSDLLDAGIGYCAAPVSERDGA